MSAYNIVFEGGDAPPFQQLYDRYVDIGLATTENGRTDVADEYKVNGELQRDKDIKTALEELACAKRGLLSVWADTGMVLDIQAMKRPGADGTELQSSASIGFATKWFDTQVWSEETIAENIETVLSLVTEMVPLVAPEFAWSGIIDETILTARKPSDRPIRDTIEHLGWVTIMSDRVVDQFGGREHVLETPAWRTKEFDTGHVLLVLSDDPFDPDPELACKEHLLNS